MILRWSSPFTREGQSLSDSIHSHINDLQQTAVDLDGRKMAADMTIEEQEVSFVELFLVYLVAH